MEAIEEIRVDAEALKVISDYCLENELSLAGMNIAISEMSSRINSLNLLLDNYYLVDSTCIRSTTRSLSSADSALKSS